MEFKCTLETRHSKKKNSDYSVLVIKISPNYEILHFPTPEQLELIKIYSSKKSVPVMPDIPFFTESDLQTLSKD